MGKELNRGLSFDVMWESVSGALSREVRETYGWLSIKLDGKLVTHVLDTRTMSARNEILVSLYPMAMWFANCWWRLLWESTPREPRLDRSFGWRMAHELVAAGDGFAWPRLVFEADGESVVISAYQTDDAAEPIRYLNYRESVVAASDFETQIEAFIQDVIKRLEDQGIGNSDLHELWSDVVAERNDQWVGQVRRLEAELGCDPEEGPIETIRLLKEHLDSIGDAATDELASALALDIDPDTTAGQLFAVTERPGLVGRLEAKLDGLAKIGFNSLVAGRQGWDLAAEARRRFDFGSGPIDNERLGSILGITGTEVVSSGVDSPSLGVGIRKGGSDKVELYFRARKPIGREAGRRFDAVRFWADTICAPPKDHWLPVTSSKTARQKFQRAFAAEFLCPFDSLQEKLGGDYSYESLEDAADTFKVSYKVVQSHLSNHGIVEFESRT